MRNRFADTGLLTAVLIVCLFVYGCGGGGPSATSGAVEGYVYVPDSSRAGNATRGGAPSGYGALNGATVEVASGVRTFPATTDGSGHFYVTGVPAGNASVTIVPPAGCAYRTLITNVTVGGNSPALIGEDGKVSLLSSTAASLSMSVEEVDVSGWPLVKLHVGVDDPGESIRLMGLQASDFDVLFNNAAVNVDHVQIQDGYVLTCRAKDATIEQFALRVDSSFCDVNGSTNCIVTRQPQHFLLPVGVASVAYSFKDPAYAAVKHPGMWHMGVDYSVASGTPVYAIARGTVLRRVVNGLVTGLVVRHNTNESLQASSGATKSFYAVYGYINPTVANGSTVQEGQQIGTVAFWAQGNHLHLGIRVGQDITGEWRLSSMIGGGVPAADANGWTNGWADPVSFYEDYSSDNTL